MTVSVVEAKLRFRRDQISSGVSRLGRLRPGGRLSIEYDLARLLPDDPGAAIAVSMRAQIGQASCRLRVWADVHVFDASDELIHTGTIALEGPEAVPTPGQERAWRADVYQGSGGGSGAGVWSRRMRTRSSRLYCQLEGTLYIDGILHQFDVPADTEVHPVSTLR